jgi:hypothetical protein
MNIKLMISLILVFVSYPVFADVQTINMAGPSPAASQNPASSPSSATFTASEKAYLTQAYRYMATEQTIVVRVAVEMSKLGPGGESLRNIEDSIKAGLLDISAAHSVYSQTAVPPKYADLDSQINNTYAQFNSAFTELLKYWIDGNEAHIDNSNILIPKAAVQQKNIILEIINILPTDQMQF